MSGGDALEAVSKFIALGGIGLAIVGMIVMTVAGASIRPRPVVAGIGGTMFAVGEFMPHQLGGDTISVAGKLLVAAAMIALIFIKSRRSRTLAGAAVLIGAGISFRDVWLRDGPAEAVRTVAIGIGLIIFVVGAYRLLRLSDKRFPSPEARGAAEVLRLRAERRAASRTGTSA